MEQKNQAISKNYQVPYQKQSTPLVNFCQNNDEYQIVKSAYSLSKPNRDEKYLEKLVDILGKWRWMTGISINNQNEDEVAKELILIAQFVFNNYPELSIEEINLSIDLSLTNKLNVDVRTFNTFSPMYVSRILNAYTEYKRSIVLEVRNRKELDDAKKEIDKKLTATEKMESLIELITYFYDEFKLKNIVDDHFNVLYSFFRKIKLLNPSKETVNLAVEYGKSKAAEYVDNHFVDIMSKQKPNKELIEKRFARNYCIQVMFTKFKLEEILEKIEIKHFE